MPCLRMQDENFANASRNSSRCSSVISPKASLRYLSHACVALRTAALLPSIRVAAPLPLPRLVVGARSTPLRRMHCSKRMRAVSRSAALVVAVLSPPASPQATSVSAVTASAGMVLPRWLMALDQAGRAQDEPEDLRRIA